MQRALTRPGLWARRLKRQHDSYHRWERGILLTPRTDMAGWVYMVPAKQRPALIHNGRKP